MTEMPSTEPSTQPSGSFAPSDLPSSSPSTSPTNELDSTLFGSKVVKISADGPRLCLEIELVWSFEDAESFSLDLASILRDEPNTFEFIAKALVPKAGEGMVATAGGWPSSFDWKSKGQTTELASRLPF